MYEANGNFTIDLKALGSFTDEQFFAFCQANSDAKFERTAQGEIIVTAPTTGETGRRNSGINFQLSFWNLKTGLGYVFDSDTGFYLPNGAMRNPDAAWIVKSRWYALPLSERESFPHLVPDFVVELRSKSDRLPVLQAKVQEWVDNGVRLAWLIDPYDKAVFIYKPNAGVHQQPLVGMLTAENVLPGFELDLALMA